MVGMTHRNYSHSNTIGWLELNESISSNI